MSSLGSDPRLIVAHWADEATRAAATDASEARANRDQDMQAATERHERAATPREGVLRRIFNRLRRPVG